MNTDTKAPQLIAMVGCMLHGTVSAAFEQGVKKPLKDLLAVAQQAACDAIIAAATDSDNPKDLNWPMPVPRTWKIWH